MGAYKSLFRHFCDKSQIWGCERASTRSHPQILSNFTDFPREPGKDLSFLVLENSCGGLVYIMWAGGPLACYNIHLCDEYSRSLSWCS